MKSSFRQVGFDVSRLALAVVVSTALVTPALAAITNKYTFNDGTAKDSVGGADGTLLGTNGSITGGQLVLANVNEGSGNPGTAGAYLDIPNFTISNAAMNHGAVSVEMWITVLQHHDWAAAFTAGTNSGNEDMSNGGGDEPYIQIIPRTGDAGLGNDFRVTANSYGGDEGFIDDSTDLGVGVKEHIVAVFDQSGGFPGAVRTYRNGLLVPAVPTEGLGGALPANLDLTTFQREDFSGGDVNIWLGRSQWGDALISARYDEVRIYDTPLNQAEVTASFNAGPDPVALPVLRIDRATGAVTFANPASSAFNLKSYSLTSASGQLNPTGWTSIDTGNTFDPDGTWTTSSLTTTNIAEAVTSGGTDGGAINGNTSKSIGSAYFRTPLAGDVQFTYTLNGGISGTGIVEYMGTAPKRSDFNADGLITPADWSTNFLPNLGKSFTGELPVAAYLKGDLDGDLDNDYNDFLLFKTDYIAANGAGAFQALTGVPEPSSCVIALLAWVAVACVRRR
ncbi:MAG: LamG-like jellyroll fold domain-containing protein [Pirellulales bacterium]